MLIDVIKPGIEVAPSFDRACELLGKITEGTLPLFAMDVPDVSMRTVTEEFGATLRAHNFGFDEDVTLVKVGSDDPDSLTSDSDFGWHFDEEPDPKGPKVSKINFHLTAHGSGLSQFLEPNLLAGHLKVLLEDWWVKRDLKENKVDCEAFVPTLYEVPFKVGRLIVFRTAGHLPLAHNFMTKSEERTSYVKVATNSEYRPLY